jgi:hypothetical protein
MARPRCQDESLLIRGKRIKVWAARWREDVIREDGTLHRTQPTVVLGAGALFPDVPKSTSGEQCWTSLSREEVKS